MVVVWILPADAFDFFLRVFLGFLIACARQASEALFPWKVWTPAVLFRMGLTQRG